MTYGDRETRHPVRPVMITLRCAKCVDGEMRHTDIVQSTHPMRYIHRCTKCGAEEAISGASYPRMEYEPERGFGPP